MRQIISIIYIFIASSLMAQSFEIYKGDTINYTDKTYRKQGLWLKLDNNDKIIEQGVYHDNKKDGLWISYYPNGKTKNEITYNKGLASGPARFYYDNGLISEEGIWDIDHWKGNYRYYNKNGKLAYDWNYNSKGKRTGEQKYYHENGILKYKGNWDDGIASGTLKIYDETGSLITERVYAGGKFASNKSVSNGEKTKEVAPAQLAHNKADNHLTFQGTGMHTVFNINGKVEKKGFFVNGKLFNGQKYLYDENDNLIKIIHYHNGTMDKTEEVNSDNANRTT